MVRTKVQCIVLIDAMGGQPLGFFDGSKKRFFLLPGSNAPIGDVSKYCVTDDASHTYQPSVYASKSLMMQDFKMISLSSEIHLYI